MESPKYTLFGQPIEGITPPFCQRCSNKLLDPSLSECYICYVYGGTFHFNKIWAFGFYYAKSDDYFSRHLFNFKYGVLSNDEREKYIREFGRILYEFSIQNIELVLSTDFLCPVPMTMKEEQEKGFNHCRMLTESLSKMINIPMEVDNLVKIKETKRQSQMKSYPERKENVKDAFRVKNPERLKGKDILLMDDIASTCATFEECAKTLKESGVTTINGLVLARNVPKKGDRYG